MIKYFVGAAAGLDQKAFERQLYIIRKHSTTLIRSDEAITQRKMAYACSFSSRDDHLQRDACLRNRFFPSSKIYATPTTKHTWRWCIRVLPPTLFRLGSEHNRYVCMSHNGEINTLRGNKNFMKARQGAIESEIFGADMRKVFPVAEPDLSDSGTFDNVLEFSLHGWALNARSRDDDGS